MSKLSATRKVKFPLTPDSFSGYSRISIICERGSTQVSDDEKARDCIDRQRVILKQLSVFRDERKQIAISLGDLRILCDEIDRLEGVIESMSWDAMGDNL